MHATVKTAQIRPGKMEETIGIYQASVAPGVEQPKGYKGAFLLTNSDTGKSISIALYETEADMIASDTYAPEWVAEYEDVVLAPPVRERYEVSVQD